ncbi:MAG: hypothetical protein V2G41_10015 [bacterium JZ-2024 1]
MIERYLAGAFFLIFIFLILSRASESNSIINAIASAVNENIALLQGRETLTGRGVVQPTTRTQTGGLF